jgi:AraC family transcriptional regulator
MQPKIVNRPAFTVVGLKYHGDNHHNEIPQLWGTFGPHIHEIRHLVHPEVFYGVMGNYVDATGEFDYVAAREVSDATEVAKGMTVVNIPARTYAVFPCTLNTMRQTFAMIDSTWLPTSGYQRLDGPEFELYDESFEAGNDNSPMFLYVPVEAKK